MARMVQFGYVETCCTPLYALFLSPRASLILSTRALRDHQHVALKIGTPKALECELRVLRHFKTIKTNHHGSLLVRQMLDEFQVDSRNGVYQCVVHVPLAISIKSFREMLSERALPVTFLKLVLKHLLLSLDFLHTEAMVIHTGKSTRIQDGTPLSLLFIIALDCVSYLHNPQISKKVIYS